MRALSNTGRILLQMAFDPEEGNQTKREELHPQSGEYVQVEEHFHRTCHRSEFQVTRICKVSHADREFRFYMAQKSMQRREGERAAVRRLRRGGAVDVRLLRREEGLRLGDLGINNLLEGCAAYGHPVN